MTIEALKELTNNKIRNLNLQLTNVNYNGEIEQISQLEKEIIECENTLDKLNSL
jgi:hypothetical protein